jgi:hypothetical protein
MGPEPNAMQTFKKSYALAEGCDRWRHDYRKKLLSEPFKTVLEAQSRSTGVEDRQPRIKNLTQRAIQQALEETLL